MLRFALSLLLVLPVAATGQDPKPKEKEAVELFNGKDLTGWGYQGEDGKFESFDGKTESSDKRYAAKDGVLTVNDGNGLRPLWTAAKFSGDMEVTLEFRAGANADSGLFLRNQPSHLQVRDDLVAGPYKTLKEYKPQDWNEVVVVVNGTTIRCTCNGEELEQKLKRPDAGPIGLEADRGVTEYRTIRMKGLK